MLPSEYGKLDVINTAISLLIPILSFQLIEAVFRYAVDFRENKYGRKVFSNAMMLSFFSFFFALGLYPVRLCQGFAVKSPCIPLQAAFLHVQIPSSSQLLLVYILRCPPKNGQVVIFKRREGIENG